MEIVSKSIHELIPYEKNARKNDKAVPLVAKSIEQFGFKVPIVIDKNNVIVCGHTRYKAAHALGIEEVPCIIADDLTDQQIKAYRLADNKHEYADSYDDMEHIQKSLNRSDDARLWVYSYSYCVMGWC